MRSAPSNLQVLASNKVMTNFFWHVSRTVAAPLHHGALCLETIKTAGATSFDCEGRLGIAGWIVDVFRWDPCYETGVYGIRYTRLTELLTSRRVPVQNSERTVSQSGYSHPSRERERGRETLWNSSNHCHGVDGLMMRMTIRHIYIICII